MRVELELYVTGKAGVVKQGESYEQHIQTGRPDQAAILQRISSDMGTGCAAVFFCGPGRLGEVLADAVQSVNTQGDRRVRFDLHKETFAL